MAKNKALTNFSLKICSNLQSSFNKNETLHNNKIDKKTTYNISQKRFENGLITSKDFIQNQINYISNRQDVINSEIDYILSVYDYKKFIGIDLFRINSK